MILAVRQLAILGTLLAILWAAGLLRSVGTTGADPLAPGAVPMVLGFALLAAHLSGRLLGYLSLPTITGYLLAGVALGPQGLGFISLEVRDSLDLINQIALGMIALTAGGELAISRLRPRLRTIGWITLLQTVALFALTSGGHVLLDRWAGAGPFSLGRGLGPDQTLALALVVGLVAVANSPASTVAVIAETAAEGPLATVSLGVTVVKDVVVIVLMSATLAAVHGLVVPGSSFDTASLVLVLEEVALSIVLGALLGAAMITWLARVGRESAFFLLGSLFLTLEAGRLFDTFVHLHIHFLIVCMTAGFAVENLSSRGEELIRNLERSSLPVYVVFFTLAGVGLDLGSLVVVGPLALVFVVWRALLLAVTSWSGARLAGEPRQVANLAWTGFLPQAGVSIGLAELVAARYPEIGGRFRTLVLAAIAINQLVGPVLFKWALRRAGEAGRQEDG